MTLDTRTAARYAADPATFRADLLIDVSGTVRRLGEVLDPWQAADFAALDPALLRCAGRRQGDCNGRVYLERPRGHSKTTDLSATVAWALAFAARPIRGYAFAADQDQARLLKDAVQALTRLNPWLGAILEVQRTGISNVAPGHPGEGSRLEVFTSDVASSYGILPDMIVADELTHWQGDGSLWHSLLSSAAKRATCLLAVISNAGFVDSWQWHVREAARVDPSWHFSRLDGPQASWITAATLQEQRRMLPALAYMRLWGNEWSTGGGDALTPADIDAAFDQRLQPAHAREKGLLYVAGIDLGLTRDCSAVVVLAVPESRDAGKVQLAHAKLWRPTLGRKIDLGEVERHVLELDERFGLEAVAFDPWQAELLASRLEADAGRRRRSQRRLFGSKPWMREVQPTPSNLRQQATLVLEYFQDRNLRFFDCHPLRSDLHKLRVEERSYGVRLTSPRDSEGHGDTFSAFALALLLAHEFGSSRLVRVGTIDDVDGRTAVQRQLDRELGSIAAENMLRQLPAPAERPRWTRPRW